MEVFDMNDDDGTSEDAEAERGPLNIGAMVEAHPVGTLAAALGIGYTLGGGLFTPFTGRVLRVGIKLGVQLALLPAIEREVANLASTLGQSVASPTEAAKDAASGPQ